ncbi:hypothetical protein J6590_041493 [Homalodisca vitripennis]|nr:hypothetical protein J6590_041493 [Homalodisca vitripennis]
MSQTENWHRPYERENERGNVAKTDALQIAQWWRGEWIPADTLAAAGQTVVFARDVGEQPQVQRGAHHGVDAGLVPAALQCYLRGFFRGRRHRPGAAGPPPRQTQLRVAERRPGGKPRGGHQNIPGLCSSEHLDSAFGNPRSLDVEAPNLWICLTREASSL